MNIINNADPKVAAEFLASKIITQLEQGKKVLWFATGGSAIAVQVLVAEIVSKHPHENLVVTLTDERFGPVGHKDSNWTQMMAQGFSLPGAKLIPILIGNDREITTQKFNAVLKEELAKADFKIGLFGVGANSHTSGIMPNSGAVDAQDWAYGYQSDPYERITITPKTILQLDEAIVSMHGEEKWPVVASLYKDIDIKQAPVHILKQVPILTVFTDYKS